MEIRKRVVGAVTGFALFLFIDFFMTAVWLPYLSTPQPSLVNMAASYSWLVVAHYKAEGADIRMVYSTLDAISIAEAEPQREVVFFAIGFETTTPPTALAIRLAREQGAEEFLRSSAITC